MSSDITDMGLVPGPGTREDDAHCIHPLIVNRQAVEPVTPAS